MDCPIVECMEKEYYLKETGKPIQLADHQRRILNHAFTPRPDGQLPYRTVVYSCPKKSGKTEIAGGITYAYARIYGGHCYSIANDEDQAASRMFNRVQEMLELMEIKDPGLFNEIVIPTKNGRIPHNGNEIRFVSNNQPNPGPHWLRYIASDYAGEAGGMPALTVFDELWAYSSQRFFRLYDEMQPTPTLPQSIRFITTYAGWYGESDLLYAIYETVTKPDPQTGEYYGERIPELDDLPCYQQGRTFVYWDHQARMPWHSDEFMDEAKNDPAIQGRESEYLRIWENRWTTGLDAFIDIKLVQQSMERGRQRGLVNHMELIAA